MTDKTLVSVVSTREVAELIEARGLKAPSYNTIFVALTREGVQRFTMGDGAKRQARWSYPQALAYVQRYCERKPRMERWAERLVTAVREFVLKHGCLPNASTATRLVKFDHANAVTGVIKRCCDEGKLEIVEARGGVYLKPKGCVIVDSGDMTPKAIAGRLMMLPEDYKHAYALMLATYRRRMVPMSINELEHEFGVSSLSRYFARLHGEGLLVLERVSSRYPSYHPNGFKITLI